MMHDFGFVVVNDYQYDLAVVLMKLGVIEQIFDGRPYEYGFGKGNF